MADKPTESSKLPSQTVAGIDTTTGENTPFIYFDGVSTFGVCHGAIQLELGANIVLPTPDGKTKTIIHITAHLRCSPNAAGDLRQSIDKALALIADAEPNAAEASKLN